MTVNPEWLDARESEFINHQLVTVFGGSAAGVRDQNLLEAAMARPLNQWAYGDPALDLFDLAAAYCFGLCKGHAFHDGNKRAAHAVATVFLQNNGIRHEPPEDQIVAWMTSLAQDSVGESEIGEWFRLTSRPNPAE